MQQNMSAAERVKQWYKVINCLEALERKGAVHVSRAVDFHFAPAEEGDDIRESPFEGTLQTIRELKNVIVVDYENLIGITVKGWVVTFHTPVHVIISKGDIKLRLDISRPFLSDGVPDQVQPTVYI